MDLNMARASSIAFIITGVTILRNACYITVAQSISAKMSLGSFFTGNQTIRSQNDFFELGLFNPSGSNATYLAIWYATHSPKTVVWVGNRNQPAVGRASFSLSSDGELKLLNSNQSVLWSSYTQGMNVSHAVLMDTGNLVLQSANLSSVWDSSDHPANTLLPNIRFRPGRNRLFSWKTPSDPADSLYSLLLRDTDELVTLWNDSKQGWTSGAWNGKIFANIPQMARNDHIFNLSVDRKGIQFSVYPNQEISSISRFTLETNGQLSFKSLSTDKNGWVYYWAGPSDPCDVYAVCGQYGVCNSSSTDFCSCPSGFEAADPNLWESQVYSSGCHRTASLYCNAKGTSDVFLQLTASFDTEDFSLSIDKVNENQCRSACLRNCSCVAYFYDKSTKKCSLPSQVLWRSTSVSGEFNLRVSAQHKRPSRIEITIGAASGGVLILLCLLGFFLFHREGRTTGSSGYINPGALNVFAYRQLQSATKKFTEGIGKGSFGAVFKGVLPGNTPVAVKKLQRLDQVSEKQFRAEVRTIGVIQHVNLVRLLGFCSEGSHRLLVLEYMPNGSLDQILFKSSKTLLDWKTRFDIALGTARAIAYLHEGCRECIIHCDIKPENILLDANFGAKVSDFGLAKLVGREFSHVLTSMRGTRGYLAPEWIAGLPITSKVDVYSFGMTVLEVISGRRNGDKGWGAKKCYFFPAWAALQISQGAEVRSLVDEKLEGKVEDEELRRAAYTALWCIQDEEEMRPAMTKVVQILEGVLDIPKPPIPFSILAFLD